MKNSTRKTIIAFVLLFILGLVAAPDSFASISEGPEYEGDYGSYNVDGTKVFLRMFTSEFPNGYSEGGLDESVETSIDNKYGEASTHKWDNETYYKTVSSGEGVILYAYSPTEDQYNWFAARWIGGKWRVMEGNGTVYNLDDGQSRTFSIEFDGVEVTFKFTNPEDSGDWNANDIQYSFLD